MLKIKCMDRIALMKLIVSLTLSITDAKFNAHLYIMSNYLEIQTDEKLYKIAVTLNALKEKIQNRVLDKSVFVDRFKKVLSTMTMYHSANTFPIGIEYSIFFQSSKTQSILNVKHLRTSEETHLTNQRKQIDVSGTVLYGNKGKLVITRILIRSSDVDALVRQLLKQFTFESYMFGYKITGDLKVVEFYTADFNLDFYSDLVESKFVHSLIFCSDCRSIKNKIPDNLVIYNNIFNLYYCMHSNKPYVSIENVEDQMLANAVFTIAAIFLVKDNLSMMDCSQGPISCMAGRNPKFYLKKIYKKDQEYDITPSRESKILTGEYMIGTKNTNELVIKLK